MHTMPTDVDTVHVEGEGRSREIRAKCHIVILQEKRPQRRVFKAILLNLIDF